MHLTCCFINKYLDLVGGEKMKRNVGLWVDKRKAVIVRIEGENFTVQEIESGVEKHTRLKGGSRSATPYGPQEISSERTA